MGPIYITVSEAIDLMDLPSDTEEQAVRTELEKFNIKNNTQYSIYYSV